MKTDSWYQINEVNVNKSLAAKKDPLSPQSSQQGSSDEEEEIDIAEAYKSPIQVTRKNKIICTVAFIVLIIGLLAYLILLGLYHSWYPEVKDHYEGSFAALYFVFLSDIVASGIGIWTCVIKTGPRPMIIACGWLLLSGLVDLCVSISLSHDDTALAQKRNDRCDVGKEDSEGCKIFSKISLLLWCSLCFAVPKIIVVFLCRINFPSVFNWMAGKQVLVDEDIMKSQSDNLTKMEAIGAAFHSPCDVTTLTARGALGGKVRKSADSHTIIVMKNDDHPTVDEDEGEGGDVPKRVKRRSTLVSLSGGRF